MSGESFRAEPDRKLVPSGGFEEKYVVRPGLQVIPLEPDQACVLGEAEQHLLRGAPFVQVAAHLVEPLGAEELLTALGTSFPGPVVFYALERLQAMRIVVPVAPVFEGAHGRFCHALGFGNAEQARAQSTAISVHPASSSPSSRTEAERVRAQLLRAGFCVAEQGGYELSLTHDYLTPSAVATWLSQWREGRLVIPFRPYGTVFWLGPVLSRRETTSSAPCPQCLAWQLRRNRPLQGYLERRALRPEISLPESSPVSLDLAASWLPFELLRLLNAETRERELLCFDLAQGQRTIHPVHCIPQCPECGDRELFARRASAPLHLSPQPKVFTEDGGHRTMPPSATYERLKKWISPVTGAVASLGPFEPRHTPFRPVYAATYFVEPAPEALSETERFGRTSMGKGRSEEQARASALCEALERSSVVYRGDEPLVRAAFEELEGAVDVRSLLHFSARQYRERDKTLRRDAREFVPLEFDPSRSLSWTPAWSLTHDQRRYLPLAYCYLEVPVPKEERMCCHDPNGNAAGNTLEEAILQGFFELVERDGTALWWYNQVPRPAYDLSRLRDDYAMRVVEHYRGYGFDVCVLDLTTDLEIPVAVALARSERDGRYVAGFGAHLDVDLSVQRALTEMHQLFEPDDPSTSPWRDTDFDDPSFLRPLPSVLTDPRVRTWKSDDLHSDVEECVRRASRLGLDTIVLDYSRPELELRTARVTVPGLRHFWPRLGEGRLYSTPVELGWQMRRKLESELNPKPLLL